MKRTQLLCPVLNERLNARVNQSNPLVIQLTQLEDDYLGTGLHWCGQARADAASISFHIPIQLIFEFPHRNRKHCNHLAYEQTNQQALNVNLPTYFGRVRLLWQNRLSHISKSIKTRLATWPAKVEVDWRVREGRRGLPVRDCNSPGDESSLLASFPFLHQGVHPAQRISEPRCSFQSISPSPSSGRMCLDGDGRWRPITFSPVHLFTVNTITNR